MTAFSGFVNVSEDRWHRTCGFTNRDIVMGSCNLRQPIFLLKPLGILRFILYEYCFVGYLRVTWVSEFCMMFHCRLFYRSLSEKIFATCGSWLHLNSKVLFINFTCQEWFLPSWKIYLKLYLKKLVSKFVEIECI